MKVAEVNYKQAVSEFNDAQRQVDALGAEALKALTGENQLDLSVVNSMLMKQKANEVQLDEKQTWATCFDDASYEAKHLVIAQLVDRNEIRKTDGYDIEIHWRMMAEQFLERKKEVIDYKTIDIVGKWKYNLNHLLDRGDAG